MAFDLPPWLIPKEEPWDAMLKGVQVGTQIAANRLRAQQVYVEAQQSQARMALAERQFVAQNEQQTLRNTLAKTKLENDTEDFATLKEWLPKFSRTTGDELSELEVPNLHSIEQTMKVSQALVEKKRRYAMAKVAQVMSKWAGKMDTPEAQAEYYAAVAESPDMVNRLGGIDQLDSPVRNAQALAVKRDAATALSAFRNSQIQLGYDKLDEITNRDENKLILQSKRVGIYEKHMDDLKAIADKRLELDTIKQDSNSELNSARVDKIKSEIGLMAERIELNKENALLRREELKLKKERFASELPLIQQYRLADDKDELATRLANDKKSSEAEKEAKRVRGLKEIYEKYENRGSAPTAPAAAPMGSTSPGVPHFIFDPATGKLKKVE